MARISTSSGVGLALATALAVLLAAHADGRALQQEDLLAPAPEAAAAPAPAPAAGVTVDTGLAALAVESCRLPPNYQGCKYACRYSSGSITEQHECEAKCDRCEYCRPPATQCADGCTVAYPDPGPQPAGSWRVFTDAAEAAKYGAAVQEWSQRKATYVALLGACQATCACMEGNCYAHHSNVYKDGPEGRRYSVGPTRQPQPWATYSAGCCSTPGTPGCP